MMHALRRGRRNLDRLLPTPDEPPAPVGYTPALVAYVTAVCATVIVVSIGAWRPIRDPATLAIGALTAIGFAVFAVRTVSGISVVWSASVFVHLAMTLTFGVPGAITAAAGAGIGEGALLAGHWFRTLFNTASFALTNLGALAAANIIATDYCGPGSAGLIGTGAGLAAGLGNCALFAGVIRLASRGQVTIGSALRRGVSGLPYNLAYGWAAYGSTLLYRQAGTVGFTMLLVPVVAGQVFLVLLARQTQQHQFELRKTEEAERRRIARDLHDTVVQVVTGWSMRLAAVASDQEKTARTTSSLGDELLEASDALRHAGTDLRTLIMDIAPPLPNDPALTETLTALLEPLARAGTRTTVEVSDDLHLTIDLQRLVLRVTQEAVRNAATHAHATAVTVRLAAQGKDIVLSVTDDGRGFTSSEAADRRLEGHIGLSGLDEIAQQARATLHISSEPGSGTEVRLVIRR